ncbi:hypothetical protein [Cellulomonas dongxiuzhuiae]|uniref:Uncharacterized protein n=1 Tax=Cellulomonas dongxiuzhuiae TaxID=2819979 RepID=A0ABX8GJB8_9CELL|nr:hypothetical protein [Cellulomonas dongxiuzhuiae]MBO3088041.1 hypothetical protein [Cellulomonas dongxiuzhuiae]MBO3094607.1 hypothetical protein [Cellulomonas dongxiuzhuiae]QWC15621.1 hypothetical protein KKR89_15220 [Cellulomonas dongxiuzhuiae]
MRPLLDAVAAALAQARPLQVDAQAGTLDLASRLPGDEPVLVLVREGAATVTCYGRVPVQVPADRAAHVADLATALNGALFTVCVEVGSPAGTVVVRGALALGPLAPVADGRPVLHPDVLAALVLVVVQDVEATVARIVDAVADVVRGERTPAEAARDVRTADLDALLGPDPA